MDKKDLFGLLPSNGDRCCLENEYVWRLSGFSSFGACVDDWMQNNGSTGWWGDLIGLGATGIGIKLASTSMSALGAGFAAYEGGLAAQGVYACSAQPCIRYGKIVRTGCVTADCVP